MDRFLLPFNSYMGGYVLQIIYAENSTHKFKDAKGRGQNIVTTKGC